MSRPRPASDRDLRRVVGPDIVETYRKHGVGPALQKFAAMTGLGTGQRPGQPGAPGAPPSPEMLETMAIMQQKMARMQPNVEYFFATRSSAKLVCAADCREKIGRRVALYRRLCDCAHFYSWRDPADRLSSRRDCQPSQHGRSILSHLRPERFRCEDLGRAFTGFWRPLGGPRAPVAWS